MGGALPASYYNPTGVSQAERQAANNTSQAYQQSTMYGGQNYVPPTVNTMSATNPYSVNTTSMLGYIPSSYQDVNPYIADYSNLGINTNTSIWNPGANTAATQQTAGTTASTYTPSQTRTLYQIKLPVGEDWQMPSWTSNPAYVGGNYYRDPAKKVWNPETQTYDEVPGDPYFYGYSWEQIPNAGGMWGTVNTMGYDPTTVINRQGSALTGKGYTTYNPATEAQSAYDKLLDDYQKQQQSINKLTEDLSKPVEVPEVNLDDYQVEGNQGQSIWEPFSWGGLAENPPAGQEGILSALGTNLTGTTDENQTYPTSQAGIFNSPTGWQRTPEAEAAYQEKKRQEQLQIMLGQYPGSGEGPYSNWYNYLRNLEQFYGVSPEQYYNDYGADTMSPIVRETYAKQYDPEYKAALDAFMAAARRPGGTQYSEDLAQWYPDMYGGEPISPEDMEAARQAYINTRTEMFPGAQRYYEGQAQGSRLQEIANLKYQLSFPGLPSSKKPAIMKKLRELQRESNDYIKQFRKPVDYTA